MNGRLGRRRLNVDHTLEPNQALHPCSPWSQMRGYQSNYNFCREMIECLYYPETILCTSWRQSNYFSYTKQLTNTFTTSSSQRPTTQHLHQQCKACQSPPPWLGTKSYSLPSTSPSGVSDPARPYRQTSLSHS